MPVTATPEVEYFLRLHLRHLVVVELPPEVRAGLLAHPAHVVPRVRRATDVGEHRRELVAARAAVLAERDRVPRRPVLPLAGLPQPSLQSLGADVVQIQCLQQHSSTRALVPEQQCTRHLGVAHGAQYLALDARVVAALGSELPEEAHELHADVLGQLGHARDALPESVAPQHGRVLLDGALEGELESLVQVVDHRRGARPALDVADELVRVLRLGDGRLRVALLTHQRLLQLDAEVLAQVVVHLSERRAQRLAHRVVELLPHTYHRSLQSTQTDKSDTFTSASC